MQVRITTEDRIIIKAIARLGKDSNAKKQTPAPTGNPHKFQVI